MIETLSETVILPIAGVILAIVMTLELIQIITDRNNFHEIETAVFFKWMFKSACAVLIVTNTWTIVMGVFEAAQSVVAGAAGVVINDATVDVSSITEGLEERLMEMDIGPLIGLWFQSLFVNVTAWEMCIRDRLDRDVPVLMTNFPTILNRLTGMFSEDRADFITSFDEYDLLIIDDLGVERSTEYAMEQMFFVIDSRYRSRRPMIITTNLKLSELKNPPDLAHARIYDRILERCAPILFAGKNFREENAGATKQAAKDIVNRKSD